MGFREADDDCALSDFKLHGRPFTCIKSPGNNRVLEERLDMDMVKSEWLQHFP
jgi:limonene-1,2-epoxide hydrolase